MRLGRGSHQGHLPQRAVRAAAHSTRAEESGLRRCRLYPHRGLSHAQRRHILPRRRGHYFDRPEPTSLVVNWYRAASRDYPSMGLLCEADLTKPDIIETAASDPERTLGLISLIQINADGGAAELIRPAELAVEKSGN